MTCVYDQPIHSFAKINLDIELCYYYQNKNIEQFIKTLLIKLSRFEDNIIETNETITNKILLLTGWNKKLIQRSLKALIDTGFVEKISLRKLRLNPQYCNKKDRVKNNMYYNGKQIKITNPNLISKVHEIFNVPTIKSTRGKKILLEEHEEAMEKVFKKLEETEKKIDMIMSILTSEQKEEIRHLRLVKEE